MDNLYKAALFDFDGVVMDTEKGYTRFWNEIGRKYFDNPGMGMEIKGQTLTRIYECYFSGEKEGLRVHLTKELEDFEASVCYEYIAGVVDFVSDLRKHGVCTAIVTSSDAGKMEKVYRQHPELLQMFDVILTSGMFQRSKPDPECFQKAMECLKVQPSESVVFEDSLHGLQAGRGSGAFVVGLSTTYPYEQVEALADVVIPDFTAMNYSRLCELLAGQASKKVQ